MQENGKIVVGTKIDTKGIDEGLKDIDKKVTAHDVSQSFNKGLGKVKGTIKNLASSIVGIFSKGLSVVGGVIKGIIGAIGGILTVVKVTIASIGKAMLKATLASMGMSATLGVIGLAGMVLVKAFKEVAENNKDLITNIKYLVYVIGEALAPVSNAVANMISQSIKDIINLLAKVITYVAYIINAWFGINILANVSKDAFMKMQESTEESSNNLDKATKNAKELKKQLAGFDEMTILHNDGTTGSIGGIGNIAGLNDSLMPTIDFDGKVPEWIKWIADNKDLVIGALAGITAGLIAMKLLGLDPIMSLGIGLIVAGIVLLIQDIIKFIKDPSWSNFVNILRDIALIVTGIGTIMVALNFSNPIGWIVMLTGAIVAMTSAIANSIIKEEEAIKKIYDETYQQEQLTKAKERAKKAYDDLINAVDIQARAEENLIEIQKQTGLSGEELWKSVENGKITYSEMTTQQRETYKAYLDLINANKNLQQANDEKIASDSKVIAQEYNVQIANDKTGRTYDKLKNDIVNAYQKGEITAEDASDSISRMMGNMSIKSYNTFTKDIPDNIKDGLNPGKYKSTFDKFKDVWNNWLDSLKKRIGLSIETKTSGGGGRGFAKGGIVLPTMPLATGGIINQPGRGVPVANAIAGERGAEGIIPLTDSQQMELLGEAIGKYITVNLTNVTDIDGRTIARKVTEINNNNNFLLNR